MGSLRELPSSSYLDSDICEMGTISYFFLFGQNNETTQYSHPFIPITQKRAVCSPLCLIPAYPLSHSFSKLY